MTNSYSIILESYLIDDIATENIATDIVHRIIDLAKALYRRVREFFHNMWKTIRRWWQKRKRQIVETKQNIEEMKSEISKVEPGEASTENSKIEAENTKMKYNIAEFEKYQEQLLEQVVNIIFTSDGFVAHLHQVLIESKSIMRDLHDGKLGTDLDSMERGLEHVEVQYNQLVEYVEVAHGIHDAYLALEWNNPLMTDEGGEMIMTAAGKLEHNIQELLHFHIEQLQQISTTDPQIKLKLVNIIKLLQKYSEYAMQIAGHMMKIALY